MHPRRDGHQLDPVGVGGQECQRAVAFQLGGLRSVHNRVLPEVIRHADAVEPTALGGVRDLGQRRARVCRPFDPAEVVDQKSDLHDTLPPSGPLPVRPPRPSAVLPTGVNSRTNPPASAASITRW
jgi:hypothetical protein